MRYLILLLLFTMSCTDTTTNSDPTSEEVLPTWETFQMPSTSIIQALIINNDNIIIGAYDAGLHILSDSIWTTYTTDDGLASNNIWCIGIDENDFIYVGHGYTSTPAIDFFDGASWNVMELPDSAPHYYSDVHSITFDENNVLWVAFHGGQILFHYSGFWYDTANDTKTFATGKPGRIAFDSDAVLWGNGGDTSFKYDDAVWQELFYNGQRLDSHTLTIDQHDLVWFGSWNRGIFVFNGAETQHFNMDNSVLPTNRINYIQTDKLNNIWVTTDSGLVKYDGSTWHTISISDSTLPHIGDYLAVDSKNNIWIAGQSQGITVYRGENY